MSLSYKLCTHIYMLTSSHLAVLPPPLKVINAPVGNSVHLDPHWSRYHGLNGGNCGNCDGLGEDKGGPEGFISFANNTVSPDVKAGGSPFHTPGRAAFARCSVSDQKCYSRRILKKS
jgi:hypothetical protein